MRTTRSRGDEAEELAARYLEARGWHVVDRNVHYRVGELDIVAEDGSYLVFVEVRSRYRRTGPSAENTVTLPKQRRLSRAARLYLARYRGACPYARFDVVAVDRSCGRISAHIRGAFDEVGF